MSQKSPIPPGDAILPDYVDRGPHLASARAMPGLAAPRPRSAVRWRRLLALLTLRHFPGGTPRSGLGAPRGRP
ncbi:hypothetical protein ACOXXX_15650 [Thalassococcus sp. BH17M4-6]|uniref:hypothetical protein n=1 Tax=Thalassococcus sp. BH17M4-6 TaxID=3413148 RepID=UPI003BC83A69